MSQIARLFPLALVAACGASTGAAIPDSTKGGSSTPPPVAVDSREYVERAVQLRQRVRERLLDERVIVDDEDLHAASRGGARSVRARVSPTLRAVR